MCQVTLCVCVDVALSACYPLLTSKSLDTAADYTLVNYALHCAASNNAVMCHPSASVSAC